MVCFVMTDIACSIKNNACNDDPPPVVVLEGGTTPLAVVRCLANAAICPTVIGYRKSDICRYSRLCSYLPSPIANEKQQQVAEWLVERFRLSPSKPFLLPTSDESALFVAKFHEMLGDSFLTWKNTYEGLSSLVSKERLYKKASSAGLRVPDFIISPTRKELDEWLCISAGPYFVKPFYVADSHSPLIDKNDVFEDCGALRDFASKVNTDRIIVQQLLSGGDGNIYDCYGLCDSKGEISSTATHLRIRQSRRDRGVTSFGEIPVTEAPFQPEELIANTATLFSVFRFHGIFGVEWLWDEKSESLMLIDVNAKPFSSIGHLGDAGLNLPLQAVQEISGGLPDQKSSLAHLYWLDFTRDIYSAKSHMTTGDLSVRQWLRDIRRARSYSYWRRDDVIPFLVASIRLCKKIALSIFRRLSKLFHKTFFMKPGVD